METRTQNYASMVGGIVLILLGIIFFAVTQGAFDLNWGSIWPIFPMLAGLGLIMLGFTTESPQSRGALVFSGSIPLLVGAFFFATTTGIFSRGDQGTLWPVYPLIVGVAFFAGYLASGMRNVYFLIPGAMLVLVSLVFFAVTLTDSYDLLGKLWPIFLIAAGVLILVAPAARRVRG
jgi:hypothetical protein